MKKSVASCGWKVRKNKSPLETAIRKVKEETQINLTLENFPNYYGMFLPGLIQYDEHNAGERGMHMNFSFIATLKDDKIDVKLSEEHSDYKWVGIRESYDIVSTPTTKEAVSKIESLRLLYGSRGGNIRSANGSC